MRVSRILRPPNVESVGGSEALRKLTCTSPTSFAVLGEIVVSKSQSSITKDAQTTDTSMVDEVVDRQLLLLDSQ